MARSRREQLESMLAAEPNDPELRYFLAMEFVGSGEAEAARRLSELIGMAPDYVPAYVQAGQTLSRLGREDEAGTVFQKGIAAARRTGNDHAAGEMEGFLDAIS